MNKIYTIGFTRKQAEEFFGLLNEHSIDLVLDVRLNNASQLAGFSKYPDIKFFVETICDCEYIHDDNFAPLATTLQRFRSQQIPWEQYKKEFKEVMAQRDISNYIRQNYSDYLDKKIALLCSEATSEICHRKLIAPYFGVEIEHL
ncbi:MAG: hypothetical protein ATN33_02810 [Epulopiscium sp. Nele67-Bin001]|nr:MAG: hypothetical protein BEN18_09765 [Epulopiscium sp. Nuni2H_MBin001]OON90508.1 MAG: hypothetical protein ATN33_02810 [Epulopiscium sp. Nele67-Bin001]